MKLEAGKYYRTRDGRKAFVACVDNPLPHDADEKCIGFVHDDVYIGATTWCSDGTNYVDGCDHEYDLVEEWVDPLDQEMWVNTYGDTINSNTMFYSTKECADRNDHCRTGVIKVRVTEIT